MFTIMFIGFIMLMSSEVISDLYANGKTVDFDDLMRTKLDRNFLTSIFMILFLTG